MTLRIASIVLVACCSLFAVPARAQFPDKPIKIIVGNAPGGATDIIARLVAKHISGPLGQPVIVENRPGASGAVGAMAVAGSPPDGYTLGLAATSSMSVNPLLRKLQYDPKKDFTHLTLIATIPHALIVNTNLPVTNLKEFISYARARPTQLNYGSAGGQSSVQHLAGAMLNQMAAIQLTDVPFDAGGSKAVTELMAGRLDIMSLDLEGALPFIVSGKVRALAVAADSRIAQLPDVPTAAEAGLPGFLMRGWYGIVGPAGLPKDVAERLAKAMSDAVKTPEMREQLAHIAATPEGRSLQSFGDFIEGERAKFAKIIKDGNIKVE
ncbi:MAG TPA: tripartite tricarboxylate transporter substrate binding protein [Ramlibacter sp.]|uniref:Bug family tripartite tricarboxylate transporter substrate binding protein n=1 Tax=Ramlibacter sp. TaxID=1917967 RepID=UPI002C60BFEF|nr:tripartite tricarboxylate transporter substrate binding protein [Ramlibacter sp.]HVZ45946.1 tripartite tricarboxylate transporter substrate binding protein [Ramlibacter sp.]